MAPGRRDDANAPSDAEDVDDRLRALHDHLASTAELPVETDASRWLGEAEAVAADVADSDAPRSAVVTRVGQVRELLSHVDDTGSEEADEHVEAALELAAAIESAVGECP